MADWIANTPDAWIIPADVRERAEAKRRGIDARQKLDAEEAERVRAWWQGILDRMEARKDADGWITISAPREDT